MIDMGRTIGLVLLFVAGVFFVLAALFRAFA